MPIASTDCQILKIRHTIPRNGLVVKHDKKIHFKVYCILTTWQNKTTSHLTLKKANNFISTIRVREKKLTFVDGSSY